MKPITPKDIRKIKQLIIPEVVIEVLNELIVKKFDAQSNSAKVYQEDLVIEICQRLSCTRSEVFDRNYLDIDPVYEQAGWKVTYDKPGWNESYEAYFVFKAKA